MTNRCPFIHGVVGACLVLLMAGSASADPACFDLYKPHSGQRDTELLRLKQQAMAFIEQPRDDFFFVYLTATNWNSPQTVTVASSVKFRNKCIVYVAEASDDVPVREIYL